MSKLLIKSYFDTTVVSAVNLPQHNLSSNNICIERSSDILIGSKTHFNGSVVIQNFIAGNEGQNSFVLNQDPGKLETPTSGILFWTTVLSWITIVFALLGTEQTSNSNWLSSLSTYIPCKSKWLFIILILICVLSALSGLAVAAYFLYLHCKLHMTRKNHSIKFVSALKIDIQLLFTGWLERYLSVRQLIQPFVTLVVALRAVAILSRQMDVHI